MPRKTMKKVVKRSSLSIQDAPDTKEEYQKRERERERERERKERQKRQDNLNFNQGDKLKVFSVKMSAKSISLINQLHQSLNRKSSLKISFSKIIHALTILGIKSERKILDILDVKTNRNKG